MQGYNVMQPMGYDAFGMPAENFAIENNSHPKNTTEENMERMQEQLLSMGFGIDWDRELSTCRADYYKWVNGCSRGYTKRAWSTKKRHMSTGAMIVRRF